MKKLGSDIGNFFDNLRVQKNFIEAQRLDDVADWNIGGDGATRGWDFKTPWVNPDDTIDLLYGIVNGAIDVFPYSSNPNRCRNNITQAWSAGENWANWNYDFTGEKDDRLTVFKEFTYFI